MPVDSLVGRIGGLTLPLRTEDFNGTFAVVDVARSRLLDLFKTAINYELSEVWERAIGNCDKLMGKRPVQDVMELEPTKAILQQRKVDFPLLCLHRFGRAEWSDHTTEIEKRDQEWRLYYILPALDVADLRRVGDVCLVVAEIVRRTIRNHGHKAYESGALQFFGDASGLGSIRVKAQIGPGQSTFADEGDTGPTYYAIVLELQTVEYSQDIPDEFGEFEGTDFHFGLTGDGGTVPEFIEAWDDVPLADD